MTKNIVVQLNVDFRRCDLCDSLDPPLANRATATPNASFEVEEGTERSKKIGTRRRIGFVVVFFESLFCWPCLLFRPGIAERGYGNLRNSLSDGGKHERSKTHMEAYKMWKTFDVSEGIDEMLSRARRYEIERHNDEGSKTEAC